MLQLGSGSRLPKLAAMELAFCHSANRLCRFPLPRRFFAVVSRLGDGVAWYTLTLVLPLIYGAQAVHVSLRLAAVGALGLVIYKWIKGVTARPRPFATADDIRLGAAPLDRYSFPSGHTLHAVGFTVVATTYFPSLVPILVPFALLVAASRVILGLHYPTDVVSGAIIGLGTAHLGLLL